MPWVDRERRLAYQRAYKKTPGGIAARERFVEKRRRQSAQQPKPSSAALSAAVCNWSRS